MDLARSIWNLAKVYNFRKLCAIAVGVFDFVLYIANSLELNLAECISSVCLPHYYFLLVSHSGYDIN